MIKHRIFSIIVVLVLFTSAAAAPLALTEGPQVRTPTSGEVTTDESVPPTGRITVSQCLTCPMRLPVLLPPRIG